MLGQAIEKGFARHAVCFANPAQMAGKSTAIDEIRQQDLLYPGMSVVGDRLFTAHGLDQLRWNDQVTRAQAGSDRLGECAQVDDGRVVLQPRKRSKRGAVVAKIAVVVVLDDVGAR